MSAHRAPFDELRLGDQPPKRLQTPKFLDSERGRGNPFIARPRYSKGPGNGAFLFICTVRGTTGLSDYQTASLRAVPAWSPPCCRPCWIHDECESGVSGVLGMLCVLARRDRELRCRVRSDDPIDLLMVVRLEPLHSLGHERTVVVVGLG